MDNPTKKTFFLDSVTVNTVVYTESEACQKQWLGVDADLSASASGRRIIFKPTSGRTEFILDTLQKSNQDNYLAPRVAATLLGKLYFLLITGAYFGCGRAATQPLVQRASHLSASRASAKGAFPFTGAMELMLQFFIALFRDLPTLVIHIRKHLRKKVLVYTYASCVKTHHSNRVHRKGLDVIVVDCENGRGYRSSLPCPAWL